MKNTLFVRTAAIAAVISIFIGGLISAFRHEEIYIICPVTWSIVVGHSPLAIWIPSWSLGVLFVGLVLLGGASMVLAPILASLVVICNPEEVFILRGAALLHLMFAFVVGATLLLILSDDYWGSVLRSVYGPCLSHWYLAVPCLVACSGVTLLTLSFFQNQQ
jgi:hypothetical protein